MIHTEQQLEDVLSAPSPELVSDLATLDGDLVVLGAGGKMGPSLCRMARRGLDAAGREDTEVYAVSRWSSGNVGDRLRERGISVVRADLASAGSFASLPDAGNVISMVGAKFGTSTVPHQAWMTNTVLSASIADRYSDSKLVAFSTGNVYPLAEVRSGGCCEDDPVGPIGEYAMSCLGRERVLEAASQTFNTPMVLLRLNYAVELRYGVLTDLAHKVASGQAVDVTTGYVNVVWQRYANEVALRCLLRATVPPLVLNVTGPETASIRTIAQQLGQQLRIEPRLVGCEAETALLSNAARCHEMFGYPDVDLQTLMAWVADWVGAGGPLWDKPTMFERRDGRF